MKALLAMLVCAVVIVPWAEAKTKPAPKPAPLPAARSAAEQEITLDDIRATVRHQMELNAGSRKQLADAQGEIAELQLVQAASAAETAAARSETAAIQKGVDDLREWGIGQQKRADKEAAESERRGKFIGFLGAAVLVALSLHLLKAAPPYTFGLPLLAAPLGYALARAVI